MSPMQTRARDIFADSAGKGSCLPRAVASERLCRALRGPPAPRLIQQRRPCCAKQRSFPRPCRFPGRHARKPGSLRMHSLRMPLRGGLKASLPHNKAREGPLLHHGATIVKNFLQRGIKKSGLNIRQRWHTDTFFRALCRSCPKGRLHALAAVLQAAANA